MLSLPFLLDCGAASKKRKKPNECIKSNLKLTCFGFFYDLPALCILCPNHIILSISSFLSLSFLPSVTTALKSDTYITLTNFLFEVTHKTREAQAGDRMTDYMFGANRDKHVIRRSLTSPPFRASKSR